MHANVVVNWGKIKGVIIKFIWFREILVRNECLLFGLAFTNVRCMCAIVHVTLPVIYLGIGAHIS
jgi:hypothetical protein